MILPMAVTDTPRPISRLCTSLTSTARQLLCQRWLQPSEGSSFTQKGGRGGRGSKGWGTITFNKNIGRRKHVLIAARRDTHHQAAWKLQPPPPLTAPAFSKESRSLPRIPRTWRKPSSNFRRQLDKTLTCLALNQKKRIRTFSLAMDSS